MAHTLGRTFTIAEAQAAGIPRHALRGRQYQRIFRGGYAWAGDAITERDRALLALRMVGSASFVSHHTAATLLGGVVPSTSDTHLGTLKRDKTQLEGLRLHHFAHPPELVQFAGVRMTAPAQTYLNLARTLELADLLVLADSLVYRGRTTPAQLRRISQRSVDGGARAREAAKLVRAGVESPNESRTRLLLVSAGLPEPMVNYRILDAFGIERRRIDLAYVAVKVAVEFDGRLHIERKRVWEQDIARREELEGEGWRFVIITAYDLYRDPAGVLARVTLALRQAGLRVADPSPAWQRHFSH